MQEIKEISKGTAYSASPAAVQEKVTEWKNFYDNKKGSVEKREASYAKLVNQYYDLVTSFYEYGWGTSFHFAPRKNWESLEGSIAKHEYYLAYKLKLEKGQKCLDVGCGVGGPARNIASFTDAQIVGLNNNAYQIKRGAEHMQKSQMSDLVTFIQGDFMNMNQIADSSYDAAYSIESTCHAPNREGVYSEIFRILKPGALYGSYEWVITDKYSESNPEHAKIKKGIEQGNGIPNLIKPQVLFDALKTSGFELVLQEDLVTRSHADYPWYRSLSGSLSFEGFRHTKVGRGLTNILVLLLEKVRLAPAGTTEVSGLLMETADDLVAGGRQEIFSPMYFVLARKPLEK